MKSIDLKTPVDSVRIRLRKHSKPPDPNPLGVDVSPDLLWWKEIKGIGHDSLAAVL